MRYRYDDYAPGNFINGRAVAWCKSDEIVDNEDGTFSFADDVVHEFGTGTEVYVIDIPGAVLFYDDEDDVLYNWSDAVIVLESDEDDT